MPNSGTAIVKRMTLTENDPILAPADVKNTRVHDQQNAADKAAISPSKGNLFQSSV